MKILWSNLYSSYNRLVFLENLKILHLIKIKNEYLHASIGKKKLNQKKKYIVEMIMELLEYSCYTALWKPREIISSFS